MKPLNTITTPVLETDFVLVPRSVLTEALCGLSAFSGEATGLTQGYLRDLLSASSTPPADDAGIRGGKGGTGATPMGSGWSSSTEPKVSALAGDHPSRGPAAIIEAACKPWEYHAGDPPADDNPLLAVYDAGLGYAFDLLARALGLETFTPSEGSESWEGDVNGTLWNILREARVADPETNEIARARAFAAANPSGGWRPIETAPKGDEETILVCDARVAGGFHQTVWWNDEPKDPCFRWDTSDGPTFHVDAFTHWQPLPAPPGALAGEAAQAAETEGLGSRASDGEAGTPQPSPQSNPPSPQDHPPSDPQMTVEEAREVLAFEADRFNGSPENCAAYLLWRADLVRDEPETRRVLLARVDAIELALRILSSNPAAVLREPGKGGRS